MGPYLITNPMVGCISIAPLCDKDCEKFPLDFQNLYGNPCETSYFLMHLDWVWYFHQTWPSKGSSDLPRISLDISIWPIHQVEPWSANFRLCEIFQRLVFLPFLDWKTLAAKKKKRLKFNVGWHKWFLEVESGRERVGCNVMNRNPSCSAFKRKHLQ